MFEIMYMKKPWDTIMSREITIDEFVMSKNASMFAIGMAKGITVIRTKLSIYKIKSH